MIAPLSIPFVHLCVVDIVWGSSIDMSRKLWVICLNELCLILWSRNDRNAAVQFLTRSTADNNIHSRIFHLACLALGDELKPLKFVIHLKYSFGCVD